MSDAKVLRYVGSLKAPEVQAALARYMATGATIEGVTYEQDEAAFLAEGRALGCSCGHIVCVCATKRSHREECPYRRAVTCAIGIECDHGRSVCPECDRCTCVAVVGAP